MIGYAMLYAIAVGLPILLAALVFSTVLRRQGRTERAIWLAALGFALVLPVVALATSSEDAPAAPLPVVETGLIGLPTVVAVPAAPTVIVPGAQLALGPDPMVLGLNEILIGIWLLVSLGLVVRWAVASLRLARRTRSCPAATVDGGRVALTQDLGPAVSGVIRPRILVPSWLLSTRGP